MNNPKEMDLISWIKDRHGYSFKGVDVEAGTEPDVFPEVVKVHNRLISRRPDGLTVGNASIFSIIGLPTRSLFKFFERYYTEATPVVEEWSMDAIYFITGPEKSVYFLTVNPLIVRFIKAYIGWEGADDVREFSALSNFRDKYLERPEGTGVAHGIFINPDLRVHVVDFAPIESKSISELSGNLDMRDLWMIDDPPANHYGLLVRFFILENKTSNPIKDPIICLNAVADSGSWHIITGPDKNLIWLVEHGRYVAKNKKHGVFAWDLGPHRTDAIAIDDGKQDATDGREQIGGLGIFSDALIGTGPWRDDLEDDYIDGDLEPEKLDDSKHQKSIYILLKPRDRIIPPNGSIVLTVYFIPVRNHLDLSRAKPLLKRDPVELFFKTESWWNLYLETREMNIDDKPVDDFIKMSEIFLRMHYGPNNLEFLLGTENAPILGRHASNVKMGNRFAPKAIYLGSMYYDHRHAYVRDNYWIARAFLSAGRFEECLNNALFFLESFRIDGVRNAYLIHDFYQKLGKLHLKDLKTDGKVDIGIDEKEELKNEQVKLDLKSGSFQIHFHPEDEAVMEGRRAQLGVSDQIPADLYKIGGGSSREYRMELPAYRLLMLKDVDVHLDAGLHGDDAILNWLPIIENYVKLAGFCANNLHVILSDETWIWPCRINDTNYHIDNTILLLAGFEYLKNRLSKLKNSKYEQRIQALIEHVDEKIHLMTDAILKYYVPDKHLSLSIDDQGNPDFSTITNEICRLFLLASELEPWLIEKVSTKWKQLKYKALERVWACNQYFGTARSDSKTNAFTGNTPGYFLSALAKIDSLYEEHALSGLLRILDATGCVYEIHDIYDEFWGTEKQRLWDTSTCLMGILDYLFGFNAGNEYLEIAPHLTANSTRSEFFGYPYKNSMYSLILTRDDEWFTLDVKRLSHASLSQAMKDVNFKDLEHLWLFIHNQAKNSSKLLSIKSDVIWRVAISPDAKNLLLRPEIKTPPEPDIDFKWLRISRPERTSIIIEADSWLDLRPATIQLNDISLEIHYDFLRVMIRATVSEGSSVHGTIMVDEKQNAVEHGKTLEISIPADITNESLQTVLSRVEFLSPKLIPWFTHNDVGAFLPGFVIGYLPPYFKDSTMEILIEYRDKTKKSKIRLPNSHFIIPVNLDNIIIPRKDHSLEKHVNFCFIPAKLEIGGKDLINSIRLIEKFWQRDKTDRTITGDSLGEISRRIMAFIQYPGRNSFEAGSSLGFRKIWWLSLMRGRLPRQIQMGLITSHPDPAGVSVSRAFNFKMPFWDAWSSLIENSHGELQVVIYHEKICSVAAQLIAQEFMMLLQKHPRCVLFNGFDNMNKLEDLVLRDPVSIFISIKDPFVKVKDGELFVDKPLERGGPIHVIHHV
ncbi:MAG: hypothetical protein ACTSWN_08960, partial [Promethearchaeota archaeon]